MSAPNPSSEREDDVEAIVLRYHAPRIEVLEAPERSAITLGTLAHARNIRGGRITIAEGVVYDVVGWSTGAEALLVEKAKCKGPGLHLGPWEHVAGTDSVDRCAACGEESGK
jgi:hypothetical protein